MSTVEEVDLRIVQDKHGAWHITIDGGYSDEGDALAVLDYFTKKKTMRVQTPLDPAKQLLKDAGYGDGYLP